MKSQLGRFLLGEKEDSIMRGISGVLVPFYVKRMMDNVNEMNEHKNTHNNNKNRRSNNKNIDFDNKTRYNKD